MELVYLVEKGRLPRTVIDRARAALAAGDAEISVVALDEAVAWRVDQIPRGAVPDLPDRVIAASALQLNVPLVTRDSRIQASGIATIG